MRSKLRVQKCRNLYSPLDLTCNNKVHTNFARGDSAENINNNNNFNVSPKLLIIL